MIATNTAPGKRDAVDRLAEVLLGLRAGTHARDEATLLAELIGLTNRIEGDRVVEVGEGDDHQREERDVHDVLRVDDVLVDEAGDLAAPTLAGTEERSRRSPAAAGSSWRR